MAEPLEQVATEVCLRNLGNGDFNFLLGLLFKTFNPVGTNVLSQLCFLLAIIMLLFLIQATMEIKMMASFDAQLIIPPGVYVSGPRPSGLREKVVTR